MSLNIIVMSIATALLACLLLWGAWSARRQQRVLGPSQYRDCMATTKMVSRFSGRIATLAGLKWVSLVGGTVVLLYQSQREPNVFLLLVALALLVTGLQRWAAERVPASILVLGSSREEQISLQAAIRHAVFPFRPVSLLETGLLRIDMKIPGDCFRIDRGADWHNAVFAFCRSLPLIVLDARNITPLVQDEIQHILREGHAYKTLFMGSETVAATLENARRRAGIQPSGSAALCLLDPEAGVRLLRYILFEREAMPAPEAPLSSLCLEWIEWQSARGTPSLVACPGVSEPSCVEVSPAWKSIRVRAIQLAPFSYQAPPNWQTQAVEGADRYAVLFRPPEESGLRNFLRRRSRLDLMVFKYTDETILDEAAFRRATEINLTSRGDSITRERVGRRCGVMSHECFFQRGFVSLGYLVRFIAHGNEYIVHWTSMNAPTMQRHMPTVEEFVARIEA